MKKMISVVFALIFAVMLSVPAVSVATDLIDLSRFTSLQLMEIRDAINKRLKNPEQNGKMTIYPGVYEVGVGIPEGKWHIEPMPGESSYIDVGSCLDITGTEIDSNKTTFHVGILIESRDSKWNKDGLNYRDSTEMILEKGMFVVISRKVSFQRILRPEDFGF